MNHTLKGMRTIEMDTPLCRLPTKRGSVAASSPPCRSQLRAIQEESNESSGSYDTDFYSDSDSDSESSWDSHAEDDDVPELVERVSSVRLHSARSAPSSENSSVAGARKIFTFLTA